MHKQFSRLAITLIIILLIGCSQSTPHGLKHLVMVKFKPETTEVQIDEFTAEFTSLKKRIPGIMAFDYGINNSPENLHKEFHHIYTLTFTDAASRDAYLIHPEHVKFTDYVGDTGIIEDVFVFDYLPTEVK
jgi:hypothetical protein